MNRFLRPLAAAIALASITAPAVAEGLSYNVGLTSLYKYNGLDQDVRAPKNARPALQGGADYAFGNGLYVGNWNSTGKFGAQGNADLEIDLYGGYRGEFGQGWRYDVGSSGGERLVEPVGAVAVVLHRDAPSRNTFGE